MEESEQIFQETGLHHQIRAIPWFHRQCHATTHVSASFPKLLLEYHCAGRNAAQQYQTSGSAPNHAPLYRARGSVKICQLKVVASNIPTFIRLAIMHHAATRHASPIVKPAMRLLVDDPSQWEIISLLTAKNAVNWLTVSRSGKLSELMKLNEVSTCLFTSVLVLNAGPAAYAKPGTLSTH